jgi:S1-C subfamily serine protease
MNKILFMLVFLPTALFAATDWKIVEEKKKAMVSILTTNSQVISLGDKASLVAASGFIVDTERRLIVTNRHVVGVGPAILAVTFSDGSESYAAPLYVDPWHDFAILKYEKCRQCVALKLRSFKAVQNGDEVFTISNDALMANTVLSGNVVNTRLDEGIRQTASFQTSLKISSGSSGSPVMTANGDVIGVNFAVPINKTGASSSFAVISDYVIDKVSELEKGNVARGDIGYQVGFMKRRDMESFGFKTESDRAIYVTGQAPGHTDLKLGDIILEVAGEKIGDDLYRYDRLIDLNMGKSISLKVFRNKQELTVAAKVEAADVPQEYLTMGGANFVVPDVFHAISLGIAQNSGVAMVYADQSSIFRSIAAINTNGEMLTVILSINDQPIGGLGDMERILKNAKPQEILKVVMMDRLAEQNIPRLALIPMSQLGKFERIKNRSNFVQTKVAALPARNQD